MLTPLIAGENDAKIALWLEVVHRVCTSVGGLGTFVALIIVIQQFTLLRTQSELVQKNTRASMDGQLYARLDSFNKFIVEHFKEYAMLDQPFERDASPETGPSCIICATWDSPSTRKSTSTMSGTTAGHRRLGRVAAEHATFSGSRMCEVIGTRSLCVLRGAFRYSSVNFWLQGLIRQPTVLMQ